MTPDLLFQYILKGGLALICIVILLGFLGIFDRE